MPTDFFSFSVALTLLKEGKRVARDGWNGKGMWVQLQRPDEHSKMRRPYIYISTVSGELVPWVASHGDLLADDWYRVDMESEAQMKLEEREPVAA